MFKWLINWFKNLFALKIKVKYHDSNIEHIAKIDKGDWIDLRASKKVELTKGDFILIPLGVSIQLPKGYEAYLVPRSSTFKNYKMLQTNSPGIIDETYCGDADEWKMPVFATQNAIIQKDERICQFRIQKKMKRLVFVEVDSLKNADRGGFGSSGKK